MAREVFSVKIKADLKREFTALIKEKGFSTCFIVETLLRAWIEGFKAAPAGKVDQSSTIAITQNFQRVVKRARRKNTFTESEYKPEDNFYNPRTNYWEYRPGPCNLNGHAAGCACSVCRIPVEKRGKI